MVHLVKVFWTTVCVDPCNFQFYVLYIYIYIYIYIYNIYYTYIFLSVNDVYICEGSKFCF